MGITAGCKEAQKMSWKKQGGKDEGSRFQGKNCNVVASVGCSPKSREGESIATLIFASVYPLSLSQLVCACFEVILIQKQ